MNQTQDNQSLDVVCFGGGDWWYHNRAHIDMQIMRRFARMGKLLYVNSIVIQKPSFKKATGGGKSLPHKIIRKARSMLRGLRDGGEGFPVYSPLTFPVHHLPWAKPLNDQLLYLQMKWVIQKLKMNIPLVWVACPGACDVALKLSRRALVFQRTDRWEEYPNTDSQIIRRYDQRLKKHADLTVFASELLYQEEKQQCQKALFLDHGVDYDRFASADQNDQIPEDIANIPHPIVGFFGGIDNHTMDIPFIEQVVTLLPELPFVFVGNTSADISNLQKQKNVHFLGQKPYEMIPHYGKCFDVCIMPWRKSRWIQACNPIKLKEYLALGKPVVSTPFAELEKYLDVVYSAKTPEKFAESVRNAIQQDNPQRTMRRRKKVKPYSWESKVEMVIGALMRK